MEKPSRQSVAVEADVAGAFKAIAAAHRLSVSEVIRRMGIWMEKQPDYIQGEVLETIPPSMRGDLAKMILERMATPAAAAAYPTRSGMPKHPELNEGGQPSAPRPGRGVPATHGNKK